jgi:hypothetical protein
MLYQRGMLLCHLLMLRLMAQRQLPYTFVVALLLLQHLFVPTFQLFAEAAVFDLQLRSPSCERFYLSTIFSDVLSRCAPRFYEHVVGFFPMLLSSRVFAVKHIAVYEIIILLFGYSPRSEELFRRLCALTLAPTWLWAANPKEGWERPVHAAERQIYVESAPKAPAPSKKTPGKKCETRLFFSPTPSLGQQRAETRPF